MTSHLALLLATFFLLLLAGEFVNCAAAHFSNDEIKTIIEGSPFHGVHGVVVHPKDTSRLFIGSIFGRKIFELNTITKELSVFVDSPKGEADDVAISPDGKYLVWSAIVSGNLYRMDITKDKKHRKVELISKNLPGINPVGFHPDGRLFANRCFFGDAIMEFPNYQEGSLDEEEYIVHKERVGNFNGFEIAPDGRMYGPIWSKKQIGRYDFETKEMCVIAKLDGTFPSGVNFDTSGRLWATEIGGRIIRIDGDFSTKNSPCKLHDFNVMVTVNGAIDNLDIDSEDNLYWSNIAEGAIYRINAADFEEGDLIASIDGAVDLEHDERITTMIKGGGLAAATGLTLHTDSLRRNDLIVADIFGLKWINPHTKQITRTLLGFGEELGEFFPSSVERTFIDGEEIIVAASWQSNAVKIIKGNKVVKTFKIKQPTDIACFSYGAYVTSFKKGNVVFINLNTLKANVFAAGFTKPAGIAIIDYHYKSIIDVVVMNYEGTDQITITVANKIVLEKAESKEFFTFKQRSEYSFSKPHGIYYNNAAQALVIMETGKNRIVQLNQLNGDFMVLYDNLDLGMDGFVANTPFLFCDIAVAEDRTAYATFNKENRLVTFPIFFAPAMDFFSDLNH